MKFISLFLMINLSYFFESYKIKINKLEGETNMPNEIQLLDAHKELVEEGFEVKVQKIIQLTKRYFFPDYKHFGLEFKREENGNLSISVWPPIKSSQEQSTTVVKEGDIIYVDPEIAILILSENTFNVYVK